MQQNEENKREQPEFHRGAEIQRADPNQLTTFLSRMCATLDDIRAHLAGGKKGFHTVGEIAQLTGRSAYTVRRWIAEGRLTATRVRGTGPRGRLLIAHDQLERLIDPGVGLPQ
jgi:excisionase family DNA binding protein